MNNLIVYNSGLILSNHYEHPYPPQEYENFIYLWKVYLAQHLELNEKHDDPYLQWHMICSRESLTQVNEEVAMWIR